MDNPPRKRRDDLVDQLGAPVYTGEPQPPFIGLVEGLISACFTVDPARAAAILPPGLRVSPAATANLYIAPSPSIGWGIRNTINSFPALMLADDPSPDTAEAGYIPLSLVSGASSRVLSAHYAPCEEGTALVERTGDLIKARILRGDRVAAEIEMELEGPVSQDSSGQDRYFCIDGTGRLVQYVISTTGPARGARLDRVTFTADAPDSWRALTPVRLNFGIWIERMLFNTSAPEPVLPPEPATAKASRAALLALMDRQGRGCAILSPDGTVLHANISAAQLLRGQGAALRRVAARVGLARPVRLERASDGPLLLRTFPADPALAGPGALLCLIDDPRPDRAAPGGELLQLLGLTPAEARIAAAVGAGLPPREAATHLGLAESTVRSSLKLIYGKLGISRQADLARILVRLGT